MEANIEDKFGIANLREISELVSQRFGEYKDLHTLLNRYVSTINDKIEEFESHDPNCLDLARERDIEYLTSIIPLERSRKIGITVTEVEKMVWHMHLNSSKITALSKYNFRGKDLPNTSVPGAIGAMYYLKKDKVAEGNISRNAIIDWINSITACYYDRQKEEKGPTYSSTLKYILSQTSNSLSQFKSSLSEDALPRHLILQSVVKNMEDIVVIAETLIDSPDKNWCYLSLAQISNHLYDLNNIDEVIQSLPSPNGNLMAFSDKAKLYASLIPT